LRRRKGGYIWTSPSGRFFTIDRNWCGSGLWECAELMPDNNFEFLPDSGWTHLKDVRRHLEGIEQAERIESPESVDRYMEDQK
jgi:hypothetical protein